MDVLDHAAWNNYLLVFFQLAISTDTRGHVNIEIDSLDKWFQPYLLTFMKGFSSSWFVYPRLNWKCAAWNFSCHLRDEGKYFWQRLHNQHCRKTHFNIATYNMKTKLNTWLTGKKHVAVCKSQEKTQEDHLILCNLCLVNPTIPQCKLLSTWP